MDVQEEKSGHTLDSAHLSREFKLSPANLYKLIIHFTPWKCGSDDCLLIDWLKAKS